MKRLLLTSGVLSFVLTATLALGLQTAPAGNGEPSGTPMAAATQADPSPAVHGSARSIESSSEEAEETNVYRHSASVRALGRLLHLDPEQTARLFEVLNFAILAAFILYFGVKYLPKSLRARREAIEKELMEARSATEEANQRLKAVEERFARLDEEIAAIRAQAEQETAAEEARIKAVIESEKQRIIASAEQEIAAAAASARRELKRAAGELAVDRAKQMIALTEEGDRLLVRQFSQDLTRESKNGKQN